MGISHTVTKERIFESLRNRVGAPDSWRGYLVSCPYCFSHWVAFVLVPLTGTYLLHVSWDVWVLDEIVDWFISSILVTVVAAFLRIVFFLIDEKQALARKEKEIAKEVLDEEVDRPSAHH